MRRVIAAAELIRKLATAGRCSPDFKNQTIVLPRSLLLEARRKKFLRHVQLFPGLPRRRRIFEGLPWKGSGLQQYGRKGPFLVESRSPWSPPIWFCLRVSLRPWAHVLPGIPFQKQQHL